MAAFNDVRGVFRAKKNQKYCANNFKKNLHNIKLSLSLSGIPPLQSPPHYMIKHLHSTGESLDHSFSSTSCNSQRPMMARLEIRAIIFILRYCRTAIIHQCVNFLRPGGGATVLVANKLLVRGPHMRRTQR